MRCYANFSIRSGALSMMVDLLPTTIDVTDSEHEIGKETMMAIYGVTGASATLAFRGRRAVGPAKCPPSQVVALVRDLGKVATCPRGVQVREPTTPNRRH